MGTTAGAEVGTSTSLRSFEGTATGFCAGGGAGVGGGACVTGNPSGVTVSGGPGVGTPIDLHSEINGYTMAVTWADAKRATMQFLAEGLAAARSAAGLPR